MAQNLKIAKTKVFSVHPEAFRFTFIKNICQNEKEIESSCVQ